MICRILEVRIQSYKAENAFRPHIYKRDRQVRPSCSNTKIGDEAVGCSMRIKSYSAFEPTKMSSIRLHLLTCGARFVSVVAC